MSNLLTIYSPTGERLEVSKPNFTDLVRHYGWKEHPPEGTKAHAKVEPVAAPSSDSAPVEVAELPVSGDTGSDVVVEGDDSAGDEGESTDGGTDGQLNSADEKAAVIAELKDRFGYDADKRLSLSKLKAKLADLDAGTAE